MRWQVDAFVHALKELRGGWLHAEARWINAEVSIRMLEEQARPRPWRPRAPLSPLAMGRHLARSSARPASQAAADGAHDPQITRLRAELASSNAQLQMMG